MPCLQSLGLWGQDVQATGAVIPWMQCSVSVSFDHAHQGWRSPGIVEAWSVGRVRECSPRTGPSCPILQESQRCLGGGESFLGGTSGLTDGSLFSCTPSVR